MTHHQDTIVQVVFPSPLRQHFDYLLPTTIAPHLVQVGARVRAPLGKQLRIGFIIGSSHFSSCPEELLKPINAILDKQPIIDQQLFKLCAFASNYYHHSLGNILGMAAGKLLRQGKAAQYKTQCYWQLTELGRAQPLTKLKRAPKQAALLNYLATNDSSQCEQQQLTAMGFSYSARQSCAKKGWIKSYQQLPTISKDIANTNCESPLTLNAAQSDALAYINQQLGQFKVCLLEGVTGSGKTEVYLQAIAKVLANNQQALLLVPEISLTPQTVSRFKRRFRATIGVLHSRVSDHARLATWLDAKNGRAQIIIGTRSAIFTPLLHPGLIIVDEEHDQSFKQQDSLRYCARDLAVIRARQEHIPIILGSATPSMESIHNALSGRYQHLMLPTRAGNALPPKIQLLDIRNQRLQESLAPTLISKITDTLAQGQQVLLFVNRRGYAPIIICHQCGFVAGCQRCDARLSFHLGSQRLHCHHCQAIYPKPTSCPQCQGQQLKIYGAGTERVEDALKQLVPDYPLVRIDSDSIRNKGTLDAALAKINDGTSRILVGTQILAKGHHFPKVTLVAILDADSGLFSADFRAAERLGQLLLQVAGRSGRSEHPGEVIIQTRHPNNPLLLTLINDSYQSFAAATLAERKATLLPPYSFMALIRAEANDANIPMRFLQTAKLKAQPSTEIKLLGPIPAPMAKRAGRFRAQLLLQSQHRNKLHDFLKEFTTALNEVTPAKQLRWTLDVDPRDLF